MGRNPFGDDATGPRRRNPFDDVGQADELTDAVNRVDHAARKIRGLRNQLGAEGLPLAATRELIDELAAALEATARALRGRTT
jgi:hypothetical protein